MKNAINKIALSKKMYGLVSFIIKDEKTKKDLIRIVSNKELENIVKLKK